MVVLVRIREAAWFRIGDAQVASFLACL